MIRPKHLFTDLLNESIELLLKTQRSVMVESLCAAPCVLFFSFFFFRRNKCLGSLMVSHSRHFNGCGTLVCSLRINMVRLFFLRGYFHWPNRIFPFTPYICARGQQAVFFQWLAAERVRALKDLSATTAGRCLLVMTTGLIFTFL